MREGPAKRNSGRTSRTRWADDPRSSVMGVRIRGTLVDIDPLNKVPLKRATRRVQKGPLYSVPQTLDIPRVDDRLNRKPTCC